MTAIYLLTGVDPKFDSYTGELLWRKSASNVSSELAEILDKATESHHRSRFKTSQEMIDVLETQGALQGGPVQLIDKLTKSVDSRSVTPQLAEPSAETIVEPDSSISTMIDDLEMREALRSRPVQLIDKLAKSVDSPSVTPQSAEPTAETVVDTDIPASIVDQFVPISAGEFMMGSYNGNDNEKPVHRVRISQSFEMGKFEVTQSQWEAVIESNPSKFKDPTRPVENVSWEDVQKFIQVLNSRNKKYKYRLPTEAEWEYACRAGSADSFAGNLDSMAWYSANSRGTTHPVGQKQPNAWGLHDMHGNVWEWCQDWYGEYPSGNVTDPQGPASGSLKVVRGGSWNFNAMLCRSAYRSFIALRGHYDYLGFRLVRTAR